ncbi:hypothetical protein [Cryptosporangium minutisporangium]|uniref:hypothetical protein n=1 Tax=Cryptosporangium minutisporangium TaxID=113569 RepID=UPI0035E73236
MSAGNGLPAPVAALAGALLRSAARRWPAEERADAQREWEAELHALAGTPVRRSVRALRYAASLAVARPPQARERSLGVRRSGAGPVAAAVVGPAVVCLGMLAALAVLWEVTEGASRLSSGWIVAVVAVTATPIAIAIGAGLFGAAIGRRLGATSFGSAAWARIAVLTLGLALLLPPAIVASLAQVAVYVDHVLMVAIAAAVLVGGIAVTARFARRSRLAAVVSVLVMTDLAVALGGLPEPTAGWSSLTSSPLWFPRIVLWPWVGAVPSDPVAMYTIDTGPWGGNVVPTAVFALAAFGVAMVRAANREATAPAAVPA